MHKNTEHVPEIKLVGLTTRTSNLSEMNPDTAKIGATMQRFFMEGIQSRIPHRKNPGRVFAIYTNYESDEHGPYTYFLGEEVADFENIGLELEALIIPPQSYVKFTNRPGPMPDVCIHMWQEIWKMKASELGGKRAYIADFEIYDERSRDPNGAVLDIYIGIQKGI